MALFAGTFENKVDAKGRVSVPAPFRAELETGTAGAFYLFPSLTETAITGCPVDWMEEMKAGLKRLPAFSPRRRALATAVFGRARLVKIDDDGRIVLPREFAAFAGLDGRAAFVGLADTFQISNPAAAADWERAAVERLLAEGFDFAGGDQ